MSDIKRVVLTTLETQKVSEKAVKKHSKTVRVCVELPESNEDKCPEYNYKDEVAAVKKKVKHITKEVNSAPNGLDPFDNDDDDVRRIALEMEAKYGSGVTGEIKRKRKGRKDDYADIGAGYDESDSFIDNTDGYDEIIPPNVTTVRGGFYINSGALEFKTDNEATSEVSSSSSEDGSESEEEELDAKCKRKRVLETSEEEDAASENSSQGLGEKKEVTDKPNISMHQAIKKKLFSHDKIQVKKRKLADQQKKTVKDLLDEKRIDLNPAENVEKDSLKENKKPMKMSSIDDAIESVINRTDDLQKAHEEIEPKVEVSRKEEPSKIGSQSSSLIEVDVTSETAKPFVKLPENLPTDILEIIENIKKSARDYKDGGKVKFFSGDVNILLLNLERKCKVLGRSSRVKVYEHLAPFVRCRKETLIKRAKNLVIEDEHKKLKRTMDKLKSHVDQLMPALVTTYEKECQKVLQKKFSQEAVNNEELKSLKAPRRRFPLSEDMRRMIRDIVSFKKRCLLHEGKQKDTLEELLTDYLKKDILILWPEGWMSMTVLKKFCSTAAMKTPDPKSLNSNINPSKHSHKPQMSSSSSTIINFSSGNNLTITPVNLTDKLSDVSNNSINHNSQSDTIIKAIKEKVLEKQHETIIKPLNKDTVFDRHHETTIKPSSKEKSESQKEVKDNGVIVINTTKIKDDPVIPKAKNCQVIDLTDSFHQPLRSKPAEDTPLPLMFPKDHIETNSNKNFENTIKNKLSAISVTTTNTHDRDDVQKVMESLKALQKLSSPSKNETSSPVSVIAFNKNYSNSNSGQTSGSVSNERTNFSGAIGFQDEFQKQFISSLNSHKTPPSSKPSYNRCS